MGKVSTQGEEELCCEGRLKQSDTIETSSSPRKYIFRSNSEVYLKDTSQMQDPDDAIIMPI